MGPPPDSRRLVCHRHMQPSDPLHKTFSGTYLPDGREGHRASVAADLVVDWLKHYGPTRLQMFTRIKKLPTQRVVVAWGTAYHARYLNETAIAARWGSAQDSRNEDMTTKLVIVGGMAGGATAAARARRLDEGAEIVVFERGEHISFANCGLPYYIGRVIKDYEDLLLTTPEAFRTRYRVDIRVFSEVTAIHRKSRQVEVRTFPDGSATPGLTTSSYCRREPSLRNRPWKAWTHPTSSPCATSRIPSGSNASWTSKDPGPPSSRAGASSAWKWGKTWSKGAESKDNRAGGRP